MDTHSYVIDKDDNVYRHLWLHSNSSYSEILKMSNRQNVTISDSFIGGGNEDCVDAVRGKNLTFENLTLSALPYKKTRTFMTLKGGIENLTIRNVNLIGKTSYPWDISLGDWTIYDVDLSRPPMRNIHIENVKHETGRKVRVLCVHSDTPTIIGGNVDVIRIPPILVKIWFRIKKMLS